MSGMEQLCNLLFEVSNEDRLRILHLLHQQGMNVTQLSKALGLSSQEASRHMSRLNKTGLTLKESDGKYHLTLYGKLLLTQVQGIDFTSRHQQYFLDHTLDQLPRPFIHRLGELSSSTFLNDIMEVFTNIETVIQEAEEYLWVITDQYLPSNMRLHIVAYERGVRERDIEAKNWVVPTRIKESLRDEEAIAQGTRHARATGLLQERMLDHLDLYLFMSEKEVAIVAFPFTDGRFDYFGFSSTDNHAHTWCREIFEHYWEHAYPRLKLADELFWWIKQEPVIMRVFKQIGSGISVVQNEVMSVLEEKFLVKRGQLTILGDHVYHRLLNG
ncbi:MAG: ArsR family transcriptional regulator [Candidatus Bathyarchaeota archaeon]|nr:ArsR family transcriptional regulator [Candidatus Bathyarchaeota archaeon]